MIYLDYSATTPVNEKVLEEFLKYSNVKCSDKLLLSCEKEMQNILKTDKDIIFTSCSTESNNLAIKGILNKYSSGEHIITTRLEHSSVKEVLNYYEQKGFVIDYVNLNEGVVDINHLKSLITKDTVLATISAVDSETGTVQPVNEIGKILKENNVVFHCDMTQSFGKVEISFDNVDLITISSHKIYGIKGVGALLKNKNIDLVPLLYGERTYNYPLIKSFILACDMAIKTVNENYKYVSELKKYLLEKLPEQITINSKENSIPHIINISYTKMKPETFMHSLELFDIYISTRSACSKKEQYSQAVLYLTNDKLLAETSVRISLSYLTTFKEIDKLIYAIDDILGGKNE